MLSRVLNAKECDASKNDSSSGRRLNNYPLHFKRHVVKEKSLRSKSPLCATAIALAHAVGGQGEIVIFKS